MIAASKLRTHGRYVLLAIMITAMLLVSLAPAASAVPGSSPPQWRDCSGDGPLTDLECAEIEVPVNWANPDGPRLTLDLARLPASEPDSRIGSVLGVPGGPGARGIDDLKRVAGDLTELRRRFDLVGYNPRNTVWMDRIPPSCMQPGATLLEPRTRREYETQAEALSEAMIDCQSQDDLGLFGYLDSISVAKDMDAVRDALGADQLSFMANSYGGVPMAAYSRLYPQRIRAVYLDGVANQVEGWPRVTLQGLATIEAVFTRFTNWCAATPACALHGDDVEAVWQKLTRDADRSPIPVESPATGPGELTGWHLRSLGFVPDPGPGDTRWLAFADAVDRARNGDGSGFAERALGNARIWATPGALAMTCADDRGYSDFAQLLRFRRQARQISPNFGAAGFDALGCSGWPLPVTNPSKPLPTGELPPFLGVGSTWVDYAWTDSFTEMIPGSVTVAYEGPGHALYLSGKKCPIRHATAYLINMTLPEPGTTCPAE